MECIHGNADTNMHRRASCSDGVNNVALRSACWDQLQGCYVIVMGATSSVSPAIIAPAVILACTHCILISHLLHCRFMPPIEAADVLCSLDNEDSCMDTYQQVSPLSASLTVHACRSQSGLWPGVLSTPFFCQPALVCCVNCCTLSPLMLQSQSSL